MGLLCICVCASACTIFSVYSVCAPEALHRVESKFLDRESSLCFFSILLKYSCANNVIPWQHLPSRQASSS